MPLMSHSITSNAPPNEATILLPCGRILEISVILYFFGNPIIL
jgi:hypothetical protein